MQTLAREQAASGASPASLASAGWVQAGALAIGVRVLIFILAAFHPIIADSGNSISPRMVNGTDLDFYQIRRQELFSAPVGNTLSDYLPFSSASKGMLAGPLFPVLLQAFQYRDGNSWPLAIFFLVAGSALAVAWLKWLDKEGVPFAGLVLFALLPSPVYYMLCVGTELPFCIFFAGFYFAYFKKDWKRTDVAVWIAMLALLLLTRPNALSILLFVIFDSARRYVGGLSLKRTTMLVGLLTAGLLFGGLFFSYFMIVFKASSFKTFFGHSAVRYLEGIYPALPLWLNHGFSLLCLLGAKILYFVGLRPSYSQVSPLYVLARMAPGLILLPGLLYLLVKGESRHKALVFLFVLPILMVGSQERYSVPIQPLLFLYAAKAFGFAGSPKVGA